MLEILSKGQCKESEKIKMDCQSFDFEIADGNLGRLFDGLI